MWSRKEAGSFLILLSAVALGVSAYLAWAPPGRPAGAGEVGRVEVFAQLPGGPALLSPGRRRRLPRPQDIAFRFSVGGSGPRFIRIEVVTSDQRHPMYEAFHYAPTKNEALDYVLELGDHAPDQVEIVVTVDAPHTASITSRFPIELEGPARRFWE